MSGKINLGKGSYGLPSVLRLRSRQYSVGKRQYAKY